MLQWDDLVKAHFHLPPDAAVTIQTFYDCIHPDDREPTRLAIERSIANRTPFNAVYRTVEPVSGAVTWIRAIGRTFYAEDGTPIVGESLDKSYPGSDGWIYLPGFNFGISNAVTIGSSSGGAGAGKAVFNDITLTKSVDSMSPILFKYASTGSHFKSARLVVRQVGSRDGLGHLQYEFNTVFVTSVNWAGNTGDDSVGESIVLKAGAMLIRYEKQNPNGTFAKPSVASWSVILNSSAFDPLPDGP